MELSYCHMIAVTLGLFWVSGHAIGTGEDQYRQDSIIILASMARIIPRVQLALILLQDVSALCDMFTVHMHMHK